MVFPSFAVQYEEAIMSNSLIDDSIMHKKLRWGVQHRLDFIRKSLDEIGKFNRGMLVEEYGISLAQAAIDVQEVIKRNPNLMWYDKSHKCYRPTVTPSEVQLPSPLPCPCCRGKADASDRFGAAKVWCSKCGIQTSLYPTKRAAIGVWNKRAEAI
jgi:hypothetical protein